ncbi:response regulator [Anaeromicropila herbilytica]|uniref:Stage 0 sporulation protein A homolog n=1 Tax=Anaeromicropila herbilytica TaxID=2785025 RepID=A0A7R7IC91_9FIRM|nr:response regulator [Anaeromicropila herbilytica]BCN30352.1 response regulator [Anaeromicropila herbilytica]
MATILLVDDSKTTRKILKNLLEDAGHTIIGEASNGYEGIQKYKELKPDLTTMDIIMPTLDGIESLKGIMKLNPKAKVVMVAAEEQPSYFVDAVKCGATEFIVKPFNPETLNIIIDKVL